MDTLGIVRDVAIVLLAVESLVIGVLLALMLVQISKLVRMLREEVSPMITSATETADTVRGTVDFVSENVVSPVIKVKSYASGIQQGLRSFFVIGKKVQDHRTRDDQESSIVMLSEEVANE